MSEIFPLAVVLSAYHNRLLCTFAELREFLDYMCGREISLWEIPRARVAVARTLAKQHPWLQEIDPPPGFRVDSGHAGRFIKQVAKHIECTSVQVTKLRHAPAPLSGVSALTTLRARR